MNVWAKMVTALRGGLNEAGEAVVDSQALRILDQEVRDASDELDQSKRALAEIIAREKVASERCDQIQAKLTEHETYAVKALEQDNEALALEVAGRIAELESELAAESGARDGFSESAGQLRAAVKAAERHIRHLKQQVDTVKAVDNVQRAQAAVAERFGSSDTKLRTAMDSLERIKEKQALEGARMSAAREMAEEGPDQSLREKLEEAGIAPREHDAQRVLERLRSRAGG